MNINNKELNGLGTARLFEIATQLREILFAVYHEDEIDRFDELIADCAVSMLEVEQRENLVQQTLIEVLKSLCQTQDVIVAHVKEYAGNVSVLKILDDMKAGLYGKNPQVISIIERLKKRYETTGKIN